MKKDKKEKKESFLVQLLKKKKSHKIAKPKTTSQIMRMFFSGCRVFSSARRGRRRLLKHASHHQYGPGREDS